MGENNIKLGPGELFLQGPDGLQPFGSIVEAEETEWTEEKWAKENPVLIKAVPETTFTAEVKVSPDVSKALTAMGESLREAAKALDAFCWAYADAVAAIVNGVPLARLQRVVKAQAALNEASPRVRRLALHGKKYRTQKKNINRALREKAKRQKNEHKKQSNAPS